MKPLIKNHFFWFSLVLAVLLVLQTVSIAKGQPILRWTPPTTAPPFGSPAAPLDTSDVTQYKAGELNIGTPKAYTNIDSHGITLGVGSAYPVPLFASAARLVVPAKIDTTAGLCIGPDLKDPNRCISRWSDVGGGSSQWITSENKNNIYYDKGNVGIGILNPGLYRLNVQGGDVRFGDKFLFRTGTGALEIGDITGGSVQTRDIILYSKILTPALVIDSAVTAPEGQGLKVAQIDGSMVQGYIITGGGQELLSPSGGCVSKWGNMQGESRKSSCDCPSGFKKRLIGSGGSGGAGTASYMCIYPPK